MRTSRVRFSRPNAPRDLVRAAKTLLSILPTLAGANRINRFRPAPNVGNTKLREGALGLFENVQGLGAVTIEHAAGQRAERRDARGLREPLQKASAS
jgi:hypothetical protein